MHVQPLDMLFAYKAISVEPNLTAVDRRVAAALLEHFNRKTGRCDPGLDRLAELLAVCQRTVIRSLNRLEGVGFFQRIRHGGHFNRNKYVPGWRRFREVEATWSAKFKVDKLSLGLRLECQFSADNAVTQTSRTNQSEETSPGLPRAAQGRTWSSPSHPQAVPPVRRGPSSTIISSTDAARAAAERRWTSEIIRHFARSPKAHSDIIDEITPELRSEATEVELQQRGAGYPFLMRKLNIPLR